MRNILALDPGTANTGWARLRETKKGWEVLGHGTNVAPKLRGQAGKVRWQVSEAAALVAYPPRATEVWLEAYFPFRWHKSSTYQLMLSGGLMTIYEVLAKLKVKPKIKGTSRSVPPKVWKDWIRNVSGEANMEPAIRAALLEFGFEDFEDASTHALDALGVGLFAVNHDLATYKGVA